MADTATTWTGWLMSGTVLLFARHFGFALGFLYQTFADGFTAGVAAKKASAKTPE